MNNVKNLNDDRNTLFVNVNDKIIIEEKSFIIKRQSSFPWFCIQPDFNELDTNQPKDDVNG